MGEDFNQGFDAGTRSCQRMFEAKVAAKDEEIERLRKETTQQAIVMSIREAAIATQDKAIERLQAELAAVSTSEWDRILAERDEAREAARWFYNEHSATGALVAWPWLEEVD